MPLSPPLKLIGMVDMVVRGVDIMAQDQVGTAVVIVETPVLSLVAFWVVWRLAPSVAPC